MSSRPASSPAPSRGLTVSTRVVLSVLFVQALAGCAADPAPAPDLVVIQDLAADFTAAEAAWEPGFYDFGTPAARPALVEGFGRNEADGERAWVWSLGGGAELEFFLATPRNVLLELTLQPFAATTQSPQVLGFAAVTDGGAVPLGSLELRPGVHVYRVPVPAAVLRVGANRIAVRHAWSRAPAEVSASRDRRPLAAAWHSLRVLEADGGSFHAAESGETPRSPGTSPRTTPDGSLHLPAGSRIDFHVALPAEARWVVDRVRSRDGAVLRVDLRRRGEAAGRSVHQGGASPGVDLDLGAEPSLARLRFTVPPGRGSITLERPRVVTVAAGPGGFSAVTVRESEPTAGNDDATSPASTPSSSPRRPASRPEAPDANSRASGREGAMLPGRRPNLVLYVIDTLRADALGAYGAETGATPRLDAFADEAVLYERARAQSPWTQPSVASLFTGLWPADHGVVSGETRLPAELPALPGLLRDAGYRTAAVVANGYLARNFGFDRGFDHFELLPDLHTRAGAVQAAALDWLDAGADDRPVFLYLHTIDPHAPYDPPPAFARRFAPGVDRELGRVERAADLANGRVTLDAAATAELTADLTALYTGDVAWQDREIGRMFDALEERGLYDDAVILVTSDHGEEFAEHGDWTHGLNLHRESLDVPLLLRLPGGRSGGERVGELVQHVDVPETLLRLAGIDPGAVLARGSGPASRRRSLTAPLRIGAKPDAPTEAAAGAPYPDLEGDPVYSHLDRFHTAGASLELGRWKLILPRSSALGRSPRLYDRVTDPRELRDVAANHPVLAGWLAAQLRRALAASEAHDTTPAPRADVDDETRERLRALGYLR